MPNDDVYWGLERVMRGEPAPAGAVRAGALALARSKVRLWTWAAAASAVALAASVAMRLAWFKALAPIAGVAAASEISALIMRARYARALPVLADSTGE